MSTFKLSLNSMSTVEKIQFTRRVAAAMELNAVYFPNPPFNFDELVDSANGTEEAFNDAAVAQAQARTLRSHTADSEGELDYRLNAVARYVQSVSGGNDHIIRACGLEVRQVAAPVGPLPSPEKLAVTEGAVAGSVGLRWRPVRGAVTYEAQSRELGGPEDWQSAGVSTRSSLAVAGLRSGARYAFRVSALGAAGQGPWSVAVAKYAP